MPSCVKGQNACQCVTDVNPPITSLARTAARFPFQDFFVKNVIAPTTARRQWLCHRKYGVQSITEFRSMGCLRSLGLQT